MNVNNDLVVAGGILYGHGKQAANPLACRGEKKSATNLVVKGEVAAKKHKATDIQVKGQIAAKTPKNGDFVVKGEIKGGKDAEKKSASDLVIKKDNPAKDNHKAEDSKSALEKFMAKNRAAHKAGR